MQVENHLAYISIHNLPDHNIAFDQNNSYKAIPELQFCQPNKPPRSSNLNNFTSYGHRLDLNKIYSNHTNLEERTQSTKLLGSYTEIFHLETDNLTFTNTVKHKIKLKDNRPNHTRSHIYPHVHKQKWRNRLRKFTNKA